MFIAAALLALLWDRFVNTAGYFTTRSYVFPVFGVFFLVVAWFCYLRMDRLARSDFPERRKKRQPPVTSMEDAIQTDPENDEDLEPDERAFCSCASSLLCGVLCLVISLV